MKLNHLHLHVLDVVATTALFTELLGLSLATNARSPALAILTDGHGFTLVLQRSEEKAQYPEGFHFGFLLDEIDDVLRFHRAARTRELEVSDVVENGRGTLVYWRTSDGFLVEVSCHRRRYGEGAGRETP